MHEQCQIQAQVGACSWSVMALESEYHRADVRVEAELGLIVAALAPDIRSTRDAEFGCNKGDVIIAIDPGTASEWARRLSGYPDQVRAAPPMQAGPPVGSPGDSAARLLAANGFEIELRLWSELSGLAQSNSSVARGYAL
jgi:LDH2 family malate/lactate/ureidoglycolate dehydrogenase